MPNVLRLLTLVPFVLSLGACGANRYVNNRGSTEYAVTIVNNCSRYTVQIWIDDEWSNRRKIFVPNRYIGSRPQTFSLPGGRHFYHLEFTDGDGKRIHEGSFTVSGNARFSMC